jgi:hypothetical protein
MFSLLESRVLIFPEKSFSRAASRAEFLTRNMKLPVQG